MQDREVEARTERFIRRGKGRDLPLDARIANELIADIVFRNRYAPGAWIREQEVAERFGVSRSPVREALRHAAREGFVVVHPWRGAQVIELSPDDAAHVFDVLEAQYGVVARLVAPCLRLADFIELERILGIVLEAAEGRGPSDRGIVAAFEFGLFLAERCPSRLASDMLIRVGQLALWQNRLLANADPDYLRGGGGVILALMQALRAGDARAAEAMARASVAHTRAALISAGSGAGGQTIAA